MIAIGLAGLLALAAPSELAQSHDPTINPPVGPRCFDVGQVTRYHHDGDRTLIVRTNTDRYYRVGFAASCPNLVRKDVNITLASRGQNSQICNPFDLRVVATASRFPTPCEVSSITPMTAEEVRALPNKVRP